ncbi:helix-turn-helix transcriptional regulator [Sphingomonas sp. RHCKR7]|uniref:helix-turn-helix transcriptional regulator n=1 Tax=Sphingomonas folli TaxID=2862497 RepID=UPI001C663499|nr:helix-turn-helix transcriptional regulator [Sphingomonas folli]MBW6526455.1 helix-turn-helix transcriptional regulator [Sphingomonas folli]
MADAGGMSGTSFHRHVKAATASGPLAYQRYIRLLEARRMIVSGEADVTGTAFATGYGSSSQFSREYKEIFGTPPIEDRRSTLRSPRPCPYREEAASA